MSDINQLAVEESLIADNVRSEMSRVFVERLADSALSAPLGLPIAAWLIYSVAGWLLQWSGRVAWLLLN